MHILIANQAPHFGASLDYSLINPNQIRNFGIPVSDHSYDSGRYFGINHEDQFIPFNTECSTIFFNYFVPTDADINACPYMVLTDNKIEWDPHEVEMAANRSYG